MLTSTFDERSGSTNSRTRFRFTLNIRCVETGISFRDETSASRTLIAACLIVFLSGKKCHAVFLLRKIPSADTSSMFMI